MNNPLFHINPLPTWIYDHQTTKILDVNNAAIEFFGYTRKEFLKLALKDLMPMQEMNRLISVHLNIEHKEVSNCFGTFAHQKKNGTLTQLEIYGHEVDFNEKQSMLVVCQDVTKKNEEEAKVRHSEERMRCLVQGAFDLVGIVDKHGNYTYMSPSSAAISGIEAEDFIGKNAFEFIHPEDADRVLASLKKVAAQGMEFIKPFRAKNHKNEWRWIETVLTNKLDSPAVNGIVVNTRDVTKQMGEKEKSKLMESVITHTNDAVLITEAKPFDELGHKIIYVNKAFTKMTGYAAEEVIGKTPKILQGPNSDFERLAKLGRAIRNWEPYEITTINYKKSGEAFWINFTVTPVADEKGAYTHWIAIERDVTDQKKAEANLISTSERLRLATTSAKMGIWDWDVVNDKLTWDDRMYELYGVKKEDFSGAVNAWKNGLHPDDTIRAIAELDDALSGKSEFRSVFRVVWPDKSVHFIEGNAIVSRDEAGNAIRMIGGNIDVTERKKAEEDILRANERFKKVTEATNDAIWDWDIVNDKFYRSNAIELFFGKKAPKILSSVNFWKDSYHPDDLAKVKQSIEEAITDPLTTKWKLEYRIYNEEGAILYVRNQGVIVRNKKGEAIRMIGAMTDVTEQKGSEAKNKFKANLLKTVGQAVIATNLAGVVNYWNKAAETIYGWTTEEAIGKKVEVLTPSDVDEKQAEQILTMLRSGETWSGEFKVQKKNGTIFPVRVSNSPVYDEDDQLIGMISISSDITQEVENKELLEQYTHDLERSNEKLRKIAWTQSHVVRAPISRILGIINLIELQNDEFEDLPVWLEQLKISTREMDAIVKKIVEEANHLNLK